MAMNAGGNIPTLPVDQIPTLQNPNPNFDPQTPQGAFGASNVVQLPISTGLQGAPHTAPQPNQIPGTAANQGAGTGGLTIEQMQAQMLEMQATINKLQQNPPQQTYGNALEQKIDNLANALAPKQQTFQPQYSNLSNEELALKMFGDSEGTVSGNIKQVLAGFIQENVMPEFQKLQERNEFLERNLVAQLAEQKQIALRQQYGNDPEFSEVWEELKSFVKTPSYDVLFANNPSMALNTSYEHLRAQHRLKNQQPVIDSWNDPVKLQQRLAELNGQKMATANQVAGTNPQQVGNYGPQVGQPGLTPQQQNMLYNAELIKESQNMHTSFR